MDLIWESNGYYGLMKDRNILRTGGIGVWNSEDVEELIVNILQLVKKYKDSKWAYIADPSRMDPILSKETSTAFIKLHAKCEEAGCKAIAFLDGNTAAMKQLSQKHQEESETNMLVQHFKSEDQALEWLSEMGI